MNTAVQNIPVKRSPHWKKTAPLLTFKFVLDDLQIQVLRNSSMKMRGFHHSFERDYETKVVTVTGRNRPKITADIKALFPDADITVAKAFVPYWRR